MMAFATTAATHPSTMFANSEPTAPIVENAKTRLNDGHFRPLNATK